MPLAFPSHPGLVAPLWRRWPSRFDPLAVGLGAAVPDVVDAVAGIGRGHLGQWYGHSLIGLVVLDVPATLLLVAFAWRVPLPRVRTLPRARLPVLTLGAAVGALSHIVSDFISHETFVLLLPWYPYARVFPARWYERWFEVPLPGYREPYPVGPHFVLWCALTAVGAVMFFRRDRARQTAG